MDAADPGREQRPGWGKRILRGVGDVFTLGDGRRPLVRQPAVWAILSIGVILGEFSTPSDQPAVVRLLLGAAGIVGFMAVLSVLDFFALRGRR